MFRQIVLDKTLLTVEKAKKLLDVNTYVGQRDLIPIHVQTLEKAIEDGTFIGGEIGIANLKYNGNQKVLVNGQHQSHVVIQTGKPVHVIWKEFECYDPEDLALLYRSFDNHRSRSLSDVLKPEAQALGITWPSRIVSLVLSGAILKEGRKTTVKNDKVELLRNYIRPGEFIDSLLTDKNKVMRKMVRHMLRAPVIAAIMLTWEKSQSDSRIFWSSVRDGENLTKLDPAFKLREFLTIANVFSGRGAAKTRYAIPKEMTSRCINAWNAFRKGQPTDLRYYPQSPIPKAS